jgi:hypothetical protein
MIGGISAGGILGAKAVVKYKGGKKEEGLLVFAPYSKVNIVFLFVLYSSDMGQVHFVVTYLEIEGLFPDGSVDKMMTFITEVQNIVNDTSIPRPIRNKLS